LDFASNTRHRNALVKPAIDIQRALTNFTPVAAAKPSPLRPAISCLGASRTPVVGARGWFRDAGVRETCTGADIDLTHIFSEPVGDPRPILLIPRRSPSLRLRLF
jgi:hypothetical protein